jgi:hypothetical protein
MLIPDESFYATLYRITDVRERRKTSTNAENFFDDLENRFGVIFSRLTAIFKARLRLRPGAYPNVEPMNGASLRLALALAANISLGSKARPGTNILAY